MSRKDYELIARVIRGLIVSPEQRAVVARAFAVELMNTNARFQMAKFLKACELPVEQVKGARQ